jgi:hypothetical protein
VHDARPNDRRHAHQTPRKATDVTHYSARSLIKDTFSLVGGLTCARPSTFDEDRYTRVSAHGAACELAMVHTPISNTHAESRTVGADQVRDHTTTIEERDAPGFWFW